MLLAALVAMLAQPVNATGEQVHLGPGSAGSYYDVFYGSGRLLLTIIEADGLLVLALLIGIMVVLIACAF